MSYISKFKGLALEGGGVAGLTYIGNYRRLLRALPDQPRIAFNFTHFAGSSVGSFMAGFLAVRASLDQMEALMRSCDFKKFKDNSWFLPKDVYDLYKKYGWYNGAVLHEWYRSAMRTVTGNPDITFLDIKNKYGTILIITKTLVMKPRCKLVAMDYLSHPNKPIADAVRESCGIPFVFEAVPGTGDEKGQWSVDGGVLLNYPITLLYRYLQPDDCMGLYITSNNDAAGHDDDIPLTPVENPLEFAESIADTWRYLAMKQHIDPEDWERTCTTEITISATKFDLSDAEKDDLIRRGEIGMDNFITYIENK